MPRDPLRCTRFPDLGYSSNVSANEIELVERARSGEVDAFTALVERNWARLVGFARSIAGDPEAEDCVQESFIAAWDKLRSLRDCSSFQGWMMRIVARRSLRRARNRTRFVPLSVVSEGADPRLRGDAEAVDVESVLALLPPRQRAVMHLTVVEGMSDGEIGVALDISPASVRSHRRRAREALIPKLRQSPFWGDERNDTAGRKEPGRAV